jgi:hypothetical protein
MALITPGLVLAEGVFEQAASNKAAERSAHITATTATGCRSRQEAGSVLIEDMRRNVH